jgi:AcrR family transcriptional regulator
MAFCIGRYKIVGMARPRSFDVDDAIDRALHLFWSKGYEGTTLGDLTDALGVNRPSLYAAFGSKEDLFRRTLERYTEGPGASLRAALEAKTAREVAHRVMRFHADAAGLPNVPRGCLLVNGALACGAETDAIRATLIKKRREIEAALAARFERAKKQGDLPADARPAELARYVYTVCNGLSVQAVGGTTREQLRRVVEMAMQAWPS